MGGTQARGFPSAGTRARTRIKDRLGDTTDSQAAATDIDRILVSHMMSNIEPLTSRLYEPATYQPLHVSTSTLDLYVSTSGGHGRSKNQDRESVSILDG